MVVRVCERAAASGASAVVVATDDARISDAVRAHGFDARMTSAGHASGTDRIAEAASQLALTDDEIVVNVGDVVKRGQVLACHPIHDAESFANPNVVKVVFDARGFALYFSRAGIPHPREGQGTNGFRHIGIYAYRVAFLRRYAGMAASPLERIEQLEQLRVLWHGHRIAVAVSPGEVPPGVDTPTDLDTVRRMISA